MTVVAAVLVAAVLLAGCAASGPSPAPPAPPAAFRITPEHAPDSLDAVLERRFTTWNFRLESGRVLPELTLVFETYGRLVPDGRNAILITHGFSSSHRAAGRRAGDRAPGWWNELIGPGKPFDTERYFVVSSNMLGSSYGSTAPRSIDPATGRPYGPDFPDITLHDIVTAQRALLDALGVRRLVAVAGPSFGGYQAFQWAVSYPDFVLGIVPVLTAPWGARGPTAEAMMRRFAADPNWNGGWHYDRGGIVETLTQRRIGTLRAYGAEALLARRGHDAAGREARL
ncbi:MAG TPA: alpha/beta fold hydrolase, partial [Candidatus Tectomicrobia bacterium]|nr:alpha/beta fold hydrolase [Candidatus Tectomicrobia bacterium]